MCNKYYTSNVEVAKIQATRKKKTNAIEWCVAFLMAITDTRLKDSPEGSLRTRNSRESMDDSAGSFSGNRCWRANWYGDLRGVVEPSLCDTATSITVRRPNLSLSRDPVYRRVYAYAYTQLTRRGHIRERALSSTHDQTTWSNGSQGTRVKGARRRAEGMQTRWSPPCRSTRTHPRHCVLRGNATLEEADPSFTGRFNRPQVRRPLTPASDPTLSPNFID